MIKTTTCSWCLLISALVLAILTTPSFAQDNPPPWRENLDCARAVQAYSGVEYCTGLDGNAHTLVIDLHQPGVRLEYVIAEGRNREGNDGECQDVNIPQNSSGPGCYDPDPNCEICYDAENRPIACETPGTGHPCYPVMSLLNAVNRNNDAAAVINTDYGAGTQDSPKFRGHGPEGFAVVRGNRIDGPAIRDTDNNAENRPWLAASQGSPLRVEFSKFPQGTDDGSKPDWVYTGIGGAPWLIRDGQIDEAEIRECKGANLGSCTRDFAQTAMALSQNGRWLYLVVVEGRNAQGTAEFLRDALQPWQAIKLDGGGSSQLWYGGLPGSSPEGRIVFAGDGRGLSQYLAVFAEPGSGIIFDAIAPEPLHSIVIDDSHESFQLSGTEAFWRESYGGYAEHFWWTRNNQSVLNNTAQWHLGIEEPGDYEIFVYIPPEHAITSSAKYEVHHSDEVYTMTVNQGEHHNEWVSLGTFGFTGEGEEYVFLGDATGEAIDTNDIAFDAVAYVHHELSFWEKLWRDISAWFESQWEKVQEWLEEIQIRLEEWWERWKAEQIARFERWLEEEFQRWLERQCTGVSLPFGLALLAMTVTLHKKRKNGNG